MTKTLTKATAKELDKANAIKSVKDILAGDDNPVIYTLARDVRSGGYGVSVDLSLIYLKDNKPFNLTYYAGEILGLKVKSKEGYNVITNTGGGMDLGFDIVYSLSCYLYEGQERAGYVLSHKWL